MSFTKSCSLAKNLIAMTEAAPRPVITWDMHERIKRNKEIWDNPNSIVHRLPQHYQERYWRNFVLAKRTPVHYDPPKCRFYWDKKRNVQLETEEFPILPEYCPEQDQGLWGGEGIVKGYHESGPKIKKKLLPRQWIPRLWFPDVHTSTLYSEVMDKHMKISITKRVRRLIDKHFGLDFYLLETPDIDINSRLGMALKRQILVCLAKQNYYPEDEERHNYIKAKYAQFVMPLEEADWYGLDLNAACRKLQDLEDNATPQPLKYKLEEELKNKLESSGLKPVGLEEDEEQNQLMTTSKSQRI